MFRWSPVACYGAGSNVHVAQVAAGEGSRLPMVAVVDVNVIIICFQQLLKSMNYWHSVWSLTTFAHYGRWSYFEERINVPYHTAQ